MALYELDLKQAIDAITEHQATCVCIQLPDGMKPQAQYVVDTITAKTGAQVLIWLGSNFGACDVPLGLQRLHVDLLISWGHNKFRKEVGW